MISYEYKIFQSAKWLKVFSHNILNSVEFDDPDEARFCIGKEDKFSILSFINPRDKYKGSYEFLIEFNNAENYVRWSQTKNPLEIDEMELESTTVPHLINISRNIQDDSFGGLALTNREDCEIPPSLLDGNIGIGNWYYAIGMNNKCNGSWNHARLPASSPGKQSSLTELWLRIPFSITCKRKESLRILFFFILIII